MPTSDSNLTVRKRNHLEHTLDIRAGDNPLSWAAGVLDASLRITVEDDGGTQRSAKARIVAYATVPPTVLDSLISIVGGSRWGNRWALFATSQTEVLDRIVIFMRDPVASEIVTKLLVYRSIFHGIYASNETPELVTYRRDVVARLRYLNRLRRQRQARKQTQPVKAGEED